MDLYSRYDKSIPQKTLLTLIQLVLLYCAYRILFDSWATNIFSVFSLPPPVGNHARYTVNFIFSMVIFMRFSFMMFYLLKRALPWEEVVSVSFAFGLYYVGFALFTVGSDGALGALDYMAILLFITGSFINTYSEIQRHQWKQNESNHGKLYTGGLFHYAMHINYFGDVLWVTSYAVLSRNLWAFAIPVLLFLFFVLYNIPTLDRHLREKYKEQFTAYESNTKKIIPFVY